MADELRIAERPELHRPVLVTAFRGWNDGGQGASLAAGFLAKAWGAAPHYVSLAPSPRAALALCQRLADLLGTHLEAAELEQAVDAYSEQVTEAVAADPDTQAYVEQLEQRVDELGPQFDVPSGDTIAAELSRYLREREEEGNGHPEGP